MKKGKFTALQEYCAKQVGIAQNGAEQFMEVLRQMVRESAAMNKPLPTCTGVSRRMGIGTATGADILDKLVKDNKVVLIQSRYIRLVPNEPEFLGGK